MNEIKLRNLREYVDNYAVLAGALGSARTRPAEDELALLTAIVESRSKYPGSLSRKDMFFIGALLSILQPRQALEIGTASGTSAALISLVIARSHAERGEALPATILHTIDRKDRCLFDESKPIGFQIAELAPALVGRIKLHTLADSSLAPALFAPGSLEFGFIDGNHQHPWPLIDLLRLLPLMPPGAWVVLDDINLPDVYRGPDVRFGARYLFEAWPEAGRLPGWNVGAVRVPENLAELRPMVETLLEKPFEVSQSGWKRYRQQLEKLMTGLWGGGGALGRGAFTEGGGEPSLPGV